MKYIKTFNQLGIQDVPLVGGKNASLGQMIKQLCPKGILIPDGFAVTVDGYWHFIDSNNIRTELVELLKQVSDYKDIERLQKVGAQARALIANGTMPDDLVQEIKDAYAALSQSYNQQQCDVAVRSSATAEDLPTASFAGQQETFLNITGHEALAHAVKHCMASLFTDRAIVYRIEKGFDHFKVALSVGVQKMIRSDLACSGVSFSLDTESGFKDAIIIDASYGLGETIVQGIVTPDTFNVHKPTLKDGFTSIIKKRRGKKRVKLIYGGTKDEPVVQVDVPLAQQNAFCLTDEEIIKLSKDVLTIDEYYSDLNGKWTPMDIEWAKDGNDGKLYILQARPETVHAPKQKHSTITKYALKNGGPNEHKKDLLFTGQSIGQHIASGPARVITDVSKITEVQKGDIIVTTMTDPDWVPAMKKAAGIITQQGGRTCHAAIVSRELGIPAIVGANGATDIIQDGKNITLDCSRGNLGYVYQGQIPFETKEIKLDGIPQAPVPIKVNIGDPDAAFGTSMLPTDGVGLARIEFIVSNAIQVHPKAVVRPDLIKDEQVHTKIAELSAGYADAKTFFIDTLAQGIGTIAAAFYPRPVIVRMSDFKTNEYKNLIGGKQFEPDEENPMIGWRGASRYCHPDFEDAFALECAAFKKVREVMGLMNVQIMIPFVRRVGEAMCVIESLEKNGLKRRENGLQLIMMVEVPSNVVLIDEFSQLFDEFSIGSNDLTQLTLAVDRDSALLADMFDERDAAAKKMFALAIEGAKRNNKPIGICGQAPSDYPELGEFLIEQGVSSLSLNPDSVIPFLMRYK